MFAGVGQPTLLHVGAVCVGGVQEGTMQLVQFSPDFSHLPGYPQLNWALLVILRWVGGFAYILRPCGSLQRTFLWGLKFLPLLPPPQVFSVRGFEVLFPNAGTLDCTVCLAPQLFLPVYPHTNVGPPTLQLPPCRESSLTRLPVSAPSTGLDECFFFYSLVVRLPYSSIFWQLWLFFVCNFVVVLLLVVRGGTVCLPMSPSWPEVH